MSENKKEALIARREELMQKKAAIQGQSKSVSNNGLRKALAPWGVKSLNELMGIGRDVEGVSKGINTAAKKYSYLPQAKKEAVLALKEASDLAVMEGQYFGKEVKHTNAYNQMVLPILEKDFGISPGDEGATWIPTGVSTSYIDEFNLERKVAGLFQEIRMPTNPFKFPVLSDGAVATQVSAATAKSPKDVFQDSTITFDAVKLSNQYLLPEELQEDSAVDVMAVIRQELIEGTEKALEIAILNGDTDGTHMDTNSIFGAGATSADSSERFWDGLRKRGVSAASSQEDAGGDALDEADLVAARKKMGKFGVNPKDLAYICSPCGYNQLMDLPNVKTLETYGSSATILAGELGRIFGIPVIVSEYMRDDLNASGVNDGVTTDRTAILLVNRKRYMMGLRRALQIRIERNQTDRDATDMVSFSRYAFNGVLEADGSNYASESSLAYIINILA